ncbi:protein of unknown function DUF308 membrane (plasmid) [Gemmatirosa kalamazoonensis]|uniref:HdeD family acid-resistance protein n=1 Tax=Gemmatirosa kalamazoonensis TaxID=861299 RepID=W0RSL3_9BACT|nr:DUF308 domain-containing protein [Gemmatirosa kalamazoonensis]AHG92578.1 protein of unknown function DUF308 membrane [Gemmatirosa kalamazoonensis]
MSAIHHELAHVATETDRRVTRAGEHHHIRWPGVALRAAAAVVVGLGTLVLPELSIAALLALFAGYTLVSAAAAVSVARELARRHERAWPFLVYGLAAALVSVVLLSWPTALTGALLGALAVWMALAGTSELVLATQLSRVLPHARLVAAVGATSVIAAGALLAQPAGAAATAARVIGVYALLSGLFLAGLAVRLRREQHVLRRRVQSRAVRRHDVTPRLDVPRP